jgi:conjugative transposon TraK protein
MLSHFKNIETAFQHIRLFTLVLIVACAATVCYLIYWSDKRIGKVEDKVLILLNGKVISALTSSKKDNIPVEAKDHIKVFHELFFTLAPDDKLIEDQISKALYLADARAKKQYDDLKEADYYSGIVSGNVSQQVSADSIVVNMDSTPYYFKYYGVQKLIRPTSTLTRRLVTEGYLRDISRSDHNPHGFLIEKWRIIDNRDLDLQKR